MIIRSLLLTAVSLVSFLPAKSWAGDCMDGTRETYLRTLERLDVNDEINSVRALDCLIKPVAYYIMGFEYFARATVLPEIQRETKATKSLAGDVIPKFLTSKAAMTRCLAAGTLAFYGIPEAYDSLQECSDVSERATFYAILGDQKAIPWIISQYRDADGRYRSNPSASFQLKMVLLNALYHLASPETLPFLNEIIESPRPKTVLPRALKVKSRIEKLFPPKKL